MTETSTELVEKAIIPENGKKNIFVILQKISELHLKNKKMTKQAITKVHSCLSNDQHRYLNPGGLSRNNRLYLFLSVLFNMISNSGLRK